MSLSRKSEVRVRRVKGKEWSPEARKEILKMANRLIQMIEENRKGRLKKKPVQREERGRLREEEGA